jgi:hypothetical protein
MLKTTEKTMRELSAEETALIAGGRITFVYPYSNVPRLIDPPDPLPPELPPGTVTFC